MKTINDLIESSKQLDEARYGPNKLEIIFSIHSMRSIDIGHYEKVPHLYGRLTLDHKTLNELYTDPKYEEIIDYELKMLKESILVYAKEYNKK